MKDDLSMGLCIFLRTLPSSSDNLQNHYSNLQFSSPTHQTAMPLFIILSLALSYFVQTESPWLQLLVSKPMILYFSVALASIGLIASLIKKIPLAIAYDVFSSGALIIWFCYWKSQPMFTADSPIFFFFPVYFSLMAAFVSAFFTSQKQQLDAESFRQMQKFANRSRLQPWVVMLCVVGGLVWYENYLLFPTMMSLLFIRFGLSNLLQESS